VKHPAGQQMDFGGSSITARNRRGDRRSCSFDEVPAVLCPRRVGMSAVCNHGVCGWQNEPKRQFRHIPRLCCGSDVTMLVRRARTFDNRHWWAGEKRGAAPAFNATGSSTGTAARAATRRSRQMLDPSARWTDHFIVLANFGIGPPILITPSHAAAGRARAPSCASSRSRACRAVSCRGRARARPWRGPCR
jgi:hypothetical protein